MKKILSVVLAVMMLAGIGILSAGAEGEYQKEVVFSSSLTITNLDPQASDSYFLMNCTHDSLVGFYNAESQTFPAELATSWEWTDAITLVLTIRENVLFSDGSVMTPEDVVYSLKRATGDTMKGKSAMAYMADAAVTGENQVTITLTEPYVDFLYTLSLPYVCIVSQKACEADPDNGAQIGTGLWIVDDFMTGDHLSMVRNDNYWGETTPTERLTYRYISENATRVIALQTGDIDLAHNLNTADWHYVEEDPNLLLAKYSSAVLDFIAFNVDQFPASDINFRKAVALALDYDDVMWAYTDGTGLVAESYWGIDGFGYKAIGRYEQNIEEAKELLKKVFPDGNATVEVCYYGEERTAFLQIVQEQLKAIGLELTFNEMDKTGFQANCKWSVANHVMAATSLTWNSQGDGCRSYLHSGSNYNFSHNTDPHVDELIDTAASETDTAKRLELYAELQQYWYDQVFSIPLYYPMKALGYKKAATGFDFNGPATQNDVRYIQIPVN